MKWHRLFCGFLVIGWIPLGVCQQFAISEDFSDARATDVGERLYREGVLSNGTPVQAIIAGDIGVDGRMFTCVACHRRSGMGSVEGAIVTWPIAGNALFEPRRRTGAWNPESTSAGTGAVARRSLPAQFQAADARPAYTSETLARAIRTGVAADGRKLSPVMPRYTLADNEMATLIHYLESLSIINDPGVDDTTLRFATVVSDDVADEDRDAMLAVLQAHIDAHNTQTRPHKRRARQSPFYKSEAFGAYRKLALDVWQLKGKPDTWREQLEAYYLRQPVFALLGGIASGSWSPIHDFSEDNGIPNIFPITNLPEISDSDWYTLYFSKGLYQEGETAAGFLQRSGRIDAHTRIVQVYREGREGETLARGFQDAWTDNGGEESALENLSVVANDAVSWQQALDSKASYVVLLWLAGEDVAEILHSEPFQANSIDMLFASSSLLDGDLAIVPHSMRRNFYLSHPVSLPDENKYRLMALKHWLKLRGIPPGNLAIQSRMFLLGSMLPAAIAHMRGEFHRNYFLEGFDMMSDQDTAIAVYPRLSFGPGQRYASKGCYITQLSDSEISQLSRVSDWIVD